MKKVFHFVLGLLLLLAASCDIVDEPYTRIIGNDDDDNEPTEVVQKVLLEEFTGHQCPNCPAGAQVANQLHEIYPEKFIVIAYHAGWFARTNTSFPVDYRTTEGTALDVYFKPGSYPSGVVNRKPYNNTIILDRSIWAPATAAQMSNEPKLQLQILTNYNETYRALSVAVTAKALTTLDPLKLCIFVTESGLVSPQVASGGTIDNYVHNHVFRASLNGTWGQNLFSQEAIANQVRTISVLTILNSSWNAQNLSIVCFAYSDVTGEIIQVEEAKVIE
jgi:hypothetical protein